MQSYRKQIEQTEQHLQVNFHQISDTKNSVLSFPAQVLGSGTSVTSEDIVAAVQKLHAAFTDLAAKYQGVHQALAVQKASYRQLHRSLHGTAPVFETKEALKKPTQAAPLPSLSGPSPFSAPTDPLVQARNSLLSRLTIQVFVDCIILLLQESSWSTNFGTGHSCAYSHFWKPRNCRFFWSPSACPCFWSRQCQFWVGWGLYQPIKHHIWSR